MPSPMPEQFGRYRILKLLGQGGMGAVYLARDGSLDRDVALKIPALDGPDAAQMVERFSREARAAATLHHPNICPVYDVGEIDGKPYLTMRYIEGRPLTKFINPDRPQNPKNVAVVIRKLALALAEAHQHGVVHRDLKPANIMIDSKNEPIVMDFGLARQMGGANEKQVTQSGMIVGTPAYMSPEQIVAEPSQIDHRTDIWSLGVILFEMLTGQLPYDGSVLQIVGAIQHVEPPLASDKRPALPEKITTICRKMMTRDKSQRYQSMNDVANDLAAFLKDAAAGSLTAGAGSTSDGALQSMALRTGNEPHTQTPRSLAGALATGVTPGVSPSGTNTPETSQERSDAGALATLMQSIVRSSSAVLRGRRKPKNAKNTKGKIAANRWAMPAAAVAGVLLLIGVLYAMSGRGGKVTTKTNDATPANVSNSVPGPSTLDPRPTWHGWPADAPKPAIAPFDAVQAKKHQDEWAAYLKVPVEYTNSIGMKFRLIPPGEFTMGRPDSEAALFPREKIGTRDQPAHKVTLTKPFYLGLTEITQKQWQQVKQSAPWSGKMHGLNDERVPASYINRSAAIDFCRKLSTLESGAYRLPTEAEWEYACRAGSTTAYWFGDDLRELKSHAWERRNAADKPHPVAQKSANPWGLHDMHGNVAEWCADSYGLYSAEAATDPLVSVGGDRWVTRGGAFWHLFHVDYRSAYRASIPDLGNSEQGFRVAVSVDDVKRSLAEKHVDSPPVDPGWQRELVFSDDCERLIEKPPLAETVTQALRDGGRRLEYRNHKTTIPATFLWPTDVTGDHECEVCLRTSAEISFWHNFAQPAPGVYGDNLVWIVRTDGANHCFHVINDPKARFVEHFWNRAENEIDLREWTTLNLRLVDGRMTASVNGKVYQQHLFTRKAAEDPKATACYVVSLGSNGDVSLEFSSIKVWRWTRKAAPPAAVPQSPPPKPAIAPFDAAQAKKHQEEWAAYLKVPVEYTNRIGMKLRLIPPGEFLMGSRPEELEAPIDTSTEGGKKYRALVDSTAPQRKVTLTEPFYLEVHELTQSQRRALGDEGRMYFQKESFFKERVVDDEATLPAENFSWQTAGVLCNRLSQKETLSPAYDEQQNMALVRDGIGYRLPTEAQWEFACRAGTTTAYWNGNDEAALNDVAWFGPNGGNRTHPVGTKPANPFGLYDMHGGIWEACQDAWDLDRYRDAAGPLVDPRHEVPAAEIFVIRGGCYYESSWMCRSSSRHSFPRHTSGPDVGARFALPLAAVRKLISAVGE